MSTPKKTCFVVMGFGEKVDFQTGRKLNLDASYHNMIKPTVEEAGLECIRADEIVHSGIIDLPMYEQLLKADVVIADLSTYNPNAFYELGVRHALRPFSTIVIAEDKLNYPFDVNHIVIRRYKHLGDDIGVGDARKFSAELKQALKVILNNQANDSPVYEFLNGLAPPQLAKVVAAQAVQAPQQSSNDPTLGVLLEQARVAQRVGDFATAKSLLSIVRGMTAKGSGDARQEDPYIIQQLALVTYKSKQPTRQKALEEARDLLLTLGPATSNDTETLGLWGAVHKRLWDETKERAHLDEAVRGYRRGFYLRNDYYNGINLAYLLNVRAANAANRAEAVADFVQARRVRRDVLEICQAELEEGGLPDEKRYWVLATQAEAYFGMGDEANAEKKLEEAAAVAPADWMKESTREQLEKLRALLADSPLKYVAQDVE
jgi:tetratricopeptide (TPR) repeat protein